MKPTGFHRHACKKLTNVLAVVRQSSQTFFSIIKSEIIFNPMAPVNSMFVLFGILFLANASLLSMVIIRPFTSAGKIKSLQDIHLDGLIPELIDIEQVNDEIMSTGKYLMCIVKLNKTGYIKAEYERIVNKVFDMEQRLEAIRLNEMQPSCQYSNFTEDVARHNITMNRTMDDVNELLNSEQSAYSCYTPQRVAIVIPFRSRENQLPTALFYLHKHMIAQKAQYRIYLAEQKDRGPFNKGALMNTAFMQIIKEWPCDCVVFHDVDMFPEDYRNFYRCEQMPIHLGVEVSTLDYKLLYGSLIGGALGMTPKQYVAANGFSNMFVLWGGEDDDMYARIHLSGMMIVRPEPISIARYTMEKHTDSTRAGYIQRRIMIKTERFRKMIDGLTTMPTSVIRIKRYRHHHRISIKVAEKADVAKFLRC